jgi:hypothetical protein
MTEKEAIKKVSNGLKLKFIENQTENICLAALTYQNWTWEDGHLVKLVKDKTYKIRELAVTLGGGSLEHIQEQTIELCKIAVHENGNALQHVNIPLTTELCILAVKQNKFAMKYVNILHSFSLQEIEKIEKEIKSEYPGLNKSSPKEILKHFQKKAI